MAGFGVPTGHDPYEPEDELAADAGACAIMHCLSMPLAWQPYAACPATQCDAQRCLVVLRGALLTRCPPSPVPQQIMRKFAMETERMDMTQEMMGDTIDDVMESASDEEEEEKVVDQVLTELGIDAMEDVRWPQPSLCARVAQQRVVLCCGCEAVPGGRVAAAMPACAPVFECAPHMNVCVCVCVCVSHACIWQVPDVPSGTPAGPVAAAAGPARVAASVGEGGGGGGGPGAGAGGGGGGGPPPAAPGAGGGGGTSMSELEARLNNLRK